MIKSFAFAAVLLAAASYVQSEVEVIDRTPGPKGAKAKSVTKYANTRYAAEEPAPVNHAGASGMGSNGNIGNSAELYYQLQVLQQEVLQLRGMVEEQAHELKRLKQQRLDDYLDLDRRLSKVGQSGSKRAIQSSDTATKVSGSTAPKGELQSYRAAIDLVLKRQDYDNALDSLNLHLKQFPKGRYAGNAQYWLGEIYLLKGELELSRQWFVKLLEDFPKHRKTPDAKFKLGKVYDMLGDKKQARKLLEDVARSDSNAANLAKDYLASNFSS